MKALRSLQREMGRNVVGSSGCFFGLGVRMREMCFELESMMRQRRES